GNRAIAQLWGRARIKDLMNLMLKGETKAGVDEVTDTALTYQLLSQYTAFVAVSDEVRVNPQEGSVAVQIPVEMPEAVSYAGIFGDVAQSYAPVKKRREVVHYPAPTGPIDEFDITLMSPGPVVWEDEDNDSDLSYEPAAESPAMSYAPTSAPRAMSSSPQEPAYRKPKNRLQIVSVTGLNQYALMLLSERLQYINLPPNVSGELVFEFYLTEGFVKELAMDKQASSVKDEKAIAVIRQSLLNWRVPERLLRKPMSLRERFSYFIRALTKQSPQLPVEKIRLVVRI
ncbi:MAG: after-VIT domain-containing protein, partial [Symploca sp. SIO3E6]|nr:after-VIT domain-containing protein [Caldora sp. SIO3E6]